MKKTVKKAKSVMKILLIALVITSCKTNKKEATQELAVKEQNKIEEKVETRKPIVFITGVDKGDSKFYKNARNYFLEKNYEVVDDAFSMEELISWVNKNYNGNNYGEIHVVTNGNPWKGLSIETVIKGDNVTSETLRKSIIQGKLPNLNKGITSKTKVVFHSYGLGDDTELMKVLKDAFIGNGIPTVIASPYYNVFGGEFSKHYLAKPYYGFYPTANSPGNVDLSKEFAKKYGNEKNIDWYKALTNETERYVGDAYSYKFNIPIQWEFDYTNSDEELPKFKIPEEIMDWINQDEHLSKIIASYKIPVEKFRWKSYVKGKKLIIKGKTTVVCVLKPLIKPYGDLQHIEPETNNLRLYAFL